MAIYKLKLKPDRVVTMHLSNQYLALDDVAVGIAATNGMTTLLYDDTNEEDDDTYIFASDVAVSASRAEDIGELAANKNWKLAKSAASRRVWTDDYSNIIGAIAKRIGWPSWSVFAR